MQASWYFDFISPFAYLQLEKVRTWRDRLDITPVPIAFGAVLKAHGQMGPAEIRGKREFTYRFVQWQADQLRIPLQFPPAHPFNPLGALRLCIALGATWESVTAIFKHIWRDGHASSNADELVEVARQLDICNVQTVLNDADVKAQLRINTDAAIAAGVFGVPTLRVGETLFWGNDASAMFEDWLDHPDRFDAAEYRRIAALPVGIERSR